MAIVDQIIGFLVSLLIGAFGIYVGGRVVSDIDDYSYAIITALIGSFVWWIVAIFVGWIPFLGALLALIAWVWVVNWRYPGGWGNAIAIGLIAWVSVVVVQFLLDFFNLIEVNALGIPGI